MLKQTAIKIAHTGNSALTSLGVNKDQRHLQELIAAEKSVLNSLQKLSGDITKASDALRTWALDEGDDLGDVLSGSATILSLFSTALSEYAEHENNIREIMKDIREREDDFKEMKRLRKILGIKMDAAEKRVSKLEPEHKNFEQQSEILAALRKEVEEMDSQISTEEAELGDFKRKAARDWMELKLGGLLDCTTKGTIIAEEGKLLIAEIPEEKTQPGAPRASYTSHDKTKDIVSEIERSVAEVTTKSTSPISRSKSSKRHLRSRSTRSLSFRVPKVRRRGAPAKEVPTDDVQVNGSKQADAESLDAPPEGLPPKDTHVPKSSPTSPTSPTAAHSGGDAGPKVKPPSAAPNGDAEENTTKESES